MINSIQINNRSGSIWFILVIFIALVMVMTNPNKQDYVNFAKEQIVKKTDNNIFATGLTSLIGQPLIENTTTTLNYVLFTIFKTNIDNYEIETLGIFNNFLPLGQVTD